MTPCQHSTDRLAEAARYALLRRLVPVLKHNMAGALQPLCMISAMLEKRLQKPDPDLATLASTSSKLNTMSREASDHCLELITWLAPRPNERVTAAAAIEDAARLLMTELSLKGFTVVNQMGDMQTELPRSVTRNVFLAALMALTDAATAPANVVLAAQLVDSEMVLTISIDPVQGELLPDVALSYRNLEWEDVEVLAEAESVRLVHTADRVELHCPVTVSIV